MRKMVRKALSEGIAEAGNTEKLRAVQDVFVLYPVFFDLKNFFAFGLSRIVFSHDKRCY